ncbi:MAG: DNA-binding protein WhiA [Ruminococcaceae bacterium]|nr:DNA-binding protein WhiA [Oscillospiraceae bacterium]
MSFSSGVKTELSRNMPQNSCCRKAECYGLLLFGRSFTKSEMVVKCANREAAHHAAQLIAEITGAFTEVSEYSLRRLSGPHKESQPSFLVTVPGDDQRRAVLSCFGLSGNEVSQRIQYANLENECCISAFLRGAFLSCGTATDPRKDYQLEFVVPYMNLAKDLQALIGEVVELGIQPGLTHRRGAYVVYLKGGERVADLIAYLGAGNAAMELMQTQMVKEVRNNVNRKTNFETANLGKTAKASAEQVLAIEKILNSADGLSFLPEELQELAMLRYRNPEMSLRELGEILSEPLSRSGINHRLQRIVELAQEL